MLAIYKREMRAYFTSPLGYAFLAVFFLFNGGLFAISTLMMGSNSSIYSYISLSLILSGVLIPVLTMKSFSDERRMRTEQLLLTSPVGLMGMVFAKFLAAFTMFGGSYIICSLINFPLLYKYGEPNTGLLVGNVIAILLVGATFVAVGLFISSLTESQIVAAFVSIGASLFLLFADVLNQFIGSSAVRQALSWISVTGRFGNFSYGILDFSALLYYFSVCFIFMFLTVRIYDKRRWS